MTITFAILDDHDRSVIETYSCDCGEGSTRSPTCHFCAGSGEVTFTQSRWTLNVTNDNANTLLAAIGIDPNRGEADGRTILDGLRRVHPDLVVRGQRTAVGENGARYQDCGQTAESALRKLRCLAGIALEACRRECPVIWG
jgi:hypothetical protein